MWPLWGHEWPFWHGVRKGWFWLLAASDTEPRNGSLWPSSFRDLPFRIVLHLGHSRDGRHDLVNGGFRPDWTLSGVAENGGNVEGFQAPAGVRKSYKYDPR